MKPAAVVPSVVEKETGAISGAKDDVVKGASATSRGDGVSSGGAKTETKAEASPSQ